MRRYEALAGREGSFARIITQRGPRLVNARAILRIKRNNRLPHSISPQNRASAHLASWRSDKVGDPAVGRAANESTFFVAAELLESRSQVWPRTQKLNRLLNDHVRSAP